MASIIHKKRGRPAEEEEEEDFDEAVDSDDDSDDDASDDSSSDGDSRGKAKSSAPLGGGAVASKQSTYQNKQRVLIISSRGITARYRHLLEDFKKLIPHHKKRQQARR